MNEDTTVKAWWQSKGVVAGLLTAVIGVLVATGVLTAEAGSAENVDAIATNWIEIATGVGVVLTGLMSAYGRISATTKIGK